MFELAKDIVGGKLWPKSFYEKVFTNATSILGKQSGIVEFNDRPTLVIADLHSRHDYLIKTLMFSIKGKLVCDLFKSGDINLVCLGDGMHSENREVWTKAMQEIDKPKTPVMDKEMTDSLNTMAIVAKLMKYPNFAFLRGNHDDIKGDFRKYAYESDMVRDWVTKKFGKDFIELYSKFESQMPLMVKGKNFIASHSANTDLDLDLLAKKDYNTYYRLSWSDNRHWSEQWMRSEFENTLDKLANKDSFWIIGHRPTKDVYRSQFNNKLIQINSPEKHVAAYIRSDFKLDRDVFYMK